MADGLYALLRAYLVERGWYFDADHFREVWNREPTMKDEREFHCWTVPQWGEYWMTPYKPDMPKSRRYESFQEAVQSQLLREEEPEAFAMFFEERTGA